jgi:hypothetical protein
VSRQATPRRAAGPLRWATSTCPTCPTRRAPGEPAGTFCVAVTTTQPATLAAADLVPPDLSTVDGQLNMLASGTNR